MNRLDQLFQQKQKNILSIYFTAGYPKLNDTLTIIRSLDAAGVDLLEIGMPFSDSLVDGPTIQESNQKALNNGMSLNVLFEQLLNVRQYTDMPLILMGYFNQVLQYGVDDFLNQAQQIGIDGVILPDLPLWEYEQDYRQPFEKHDIYNVFLITPQTNDKRIEQLDAISQGFIYVVSASATTGAKQQLSTESYLQKINTMALKNPRLIGFGISNHSTFRKACEYGHGAIIGSAFIKALKHTKNIATTCTEFVHRIRGEA